jgi:hypothetical protein
LDEDEDEGLPRQFLYHANDEGGKLKASSSEFIPKFKKMSGAEWPVLEEGIKVSKTNIEGFCHDFNNYSRTYIATESNCQTFVEELVVHLGLSKACLPLTAVVTKQKASCFGFSSISTCVSNVSGWAISREMILNSFANPETAKKLFGEAMEYGMTHLTLLESAGIKKLAKETG